MSPSETHLSDPHGSVARLDQVRAEIARAARDFGRDPAGITLVAVSKTFPAEAIEPVLAAGQRVFGENYVQEAKAKWAPLRERYPGVELHLVGPLQSNKARDAVRLFDAIHSLDRDSLAAALAKEIGKAGRAPRLLVQVNTGEEPQKGGVMPGGRRRLHRRLPRQARARHRGPDVHPAGRRAALAAFRAARQDRGAQRPQARCRWA